jgi:hypothetical protein
MRYVLKTNFALPMWAIDKAMIFPCKMLKGRTAFFTAQRDTRCPTERSSTAALLRWAAYTVVHFTVNFQSKFRIAIYPLSIPEVSMAIDQQESCCCMWLSATSSPLTNVLAPSNSRFFFLESLYPSSSVTQYNELFFPSYPRPTHACTATLTSLTAPPGRISQSVQCRPNPIDVSTAAECAVPIQTQSLFHENLSRRT